MVFYLLPLGAVMAAITEWFSMYMWQVVGTVDFSVIIGGHRRRCRGLGRQKPRWRRHARARRDHGRSRESRGAIGAA